MLGLIWGYGAVALHGLEGFRAELASIACIFNDAPWALESENADLRRAIADEYGEPCITLEAAISIGFLQEMGVAPQAVEQLAAWTVSERRPPVPMDWTDLSRREQQVARLVAQGLTDIEIARSICLNPRAVAFHIYVVMKKTGIRYRHDLALLVAKHAG